MRAIIKGAKSFKGRFQPPPDKSISHRAAIFSSIAEGESRIENFLIAKDCLATINALKMLGVELDLDPSKQVLTVAGRGFDGLHEPEDVIDASNSASTMRILAGLLSVYSFLSVITGDSSLRNRPMDRVIEPLRKMGATIFAREGRFAPLCIVGGKLKGIDYLMPVASAQLKTALILAGLRADGLTRLREPARSRDHTERMLREQGVDLEISGEEITVKPTSRLKPLSLKVPGDFSSAAFFIVAALILNDSEVLVENVNLNPTRCGLLDVLKRMGAGIEESVVSKKIEPVGKIIARSSNLIATEVGGSVWPRLIDEGPVLFLAMSLAEGTSYVTGASELRVKETDRLRAMASELKKMGAKIEEKDDGLVIRGVKRFKGARVKSYGDHRIAMTLAIAALKAEGDTIIEGAECVEVSFPDFFKLLSKVCSAEVSLVR